MMERGCAWAAGKEVESLSKKNFGEGEINIEKRGKKIKMKFLSRSFTQAVI